MGFAWSTPSPGRFTPGEDSVPIAPKAGCAPGPVWKGADNLAPTPAGYKVEKYKINLLKPTGYVMHHQFNIQQLYALPTLYLCVLYLSENKQRLVPLTAKNDWFL